jgi:hypothetical protein
MEVMNMDTNRSKMKGASAREPLPAYSGTYLSTMTPDSREVSGAGLLIKYNSTEEGVPS